MEDKELFFHCDNCGVLCRQTATYCNSCGKSFVKVDSDGITLELDNELEEGVTYSDARRFIEKNPDRFMDVFKKNKGKKVFFSLNLPALFIAPYWLLYRKMYKNFIICLAGSLVFTLLVTLIVYLCTFSLRSEINSWLLYLTETLGVADLESVDFAALLESGVLSDYYHYNSLVNQLSLTLTLWVLISNLIYSIGFSVICDCLYRNFVVQGVKKNAVGGVCWTWVIVYLAVNLLLSFL